MRTDRKLRTESLERREVFSANPIGLPADIDVGAENDTFAPAETAWIGTADGNVYKFAARTDSHVNFFAGGIFVNGGDVKAGPQASSFFAGTNPVGVRDLAGPETSGFFAFEPNFTGGITVGSGDINAGGQASSFSWRASNPTTLRSDLDPSSVDAVFNNGGVLSILWDDTPIDV